MSRNNAESVRGQRGFTLVEVIVAIAVVTVGVLSTVSVASTTIKASADNERRTGATNLSREGIELVRNIRDSNWVLRDQQKKVGTAIGLRHKWDCFETSPQQAGGSPRTCGGGNLSTLAATNFRIYPATGSYTPYLIQSTNQATANSDYLICLQTEAGLTYYKPKAAAPCAGGNQYYRRIEIIGNQRDLNGVKSFLVRSHVTWSERAAKGQPGITIEEYLTDWKS